MLGNDHIEADGRRQYRRGTAIWTPVAATGSALMTAGILTILGVGVMTFANSEARATNPSHEPPQPDTRPAWLLGGVGGIALGGVGLGLGLRGLNDSHDYANRPGRVMPTAELQQEIDAFNGRP